MSGLHRRMVFAAINVISTSDRNLVSPAVDGKCTWAPIISAAFKASFSRTERLP